MRTESESDILRIVELPVEFQVPCTVCAGKAVEVVVYDREHEVEVVEAHCLAHQWEGAE